MAGRLSVSLVILALALPAAAAAQQLPVEGTTVPVYQGEDPSLLPPPADAAPPPATPISPSDPAAPFLEPLSAYGSWIALDGFGLVWQPDARLVGATFTPYLTAGRWELTQVGWQFASELPFAWAVFHYGRWLYDSEVGWVWAPDTEWGASWVDWQQAGSYVGWAPLPPAGYAYPAGYGPSYVFVSALYMTSVDLWPYLVSGVGVRRYVEMASPCGYASYGTREWPYGPPPGLLLSAGGSLPAPATIPVPPSGHVYRGAVEVNVPPGLGAVEVRTPDGSPRGSVVVRTAAVPVVSADGLPGSWRSAAAVTAPRWGSIPIRTAPAPYGAPASAGIPGIHSVVTLPARGDVAPRYVQQATAYGRPPPVPTWATSPARFAPAAAMPGPSVPSWGAPGVSAPPVVSGGYGGFRPAPSYGSSFQTSPGFGGGVHVAAPAPAMPGPSFGGGGFVGGGGGFAGFHPSSAPAPSGGAPVYRPAPSFGGGGGGFVGGAAFGGGFRPAAVGGVGVRAR